MWQRHTPARADRRERPLRRVQVHCGEVARTLADLNASENCVAAALLHSALDAGMLTEQALREAMPKHVADTVCNVSKLASICQVRAARLRTCMGPSSPAPRSAPAGGSCELQPHAPPRVDAAQMLWRAGCTLCRFTILFSLCIVTNCLGAVLEHREAGF